MHQGGLGIVIEELHKKIDRSWDSHLKETRELLRVPSVSFTGEGIETDTQTPSETPAPQKQRKTPLRGGLEGPDWSKFM